MRAVVTSTSGVQHRHLFPANARANNVVWVSFPCPGLLHVVFWNTPYYSDLAAHDAGVAKLADAQDLKSWDPQGSYGFDSRPRHSRNPRPTRACGHSASYEVPSRCSRNTRTVPETVPATNQPQPTPAKIERNLTLSLDRRWLRGRRTCRTGIRLPRHPFPGVESRQSNRRLLACVSVSLGRPNCGKQKRAGYGATKQHRKPNVPPMVLDQVPQSEAGKRRARITENTGQTATAVAAARLVARFAATMARRHCGP
jgi:hypothetical protein